MTEAATFLTAFAHALATMALYRDAHPARERAIDAAYSALLDLQARLPRPLFTLLGEDVVCGQQPVRELRGWDWAKRMSSAGIQRLEFDPGVTREDFDSFLDEVMARTMSSAIDTAMSRQMRQSGIRFGAVGVRGETPDVETPTAVTDMSLGVEADTVQWLHDQLQADRQLHLAEAEAVVRSLTVVMRGEQQLMMPLLRLRQFDEYTTTHALNVAVLAMAFAEFLDLPAHDIRAFGIAGLLHDIGKINIPKDVLTKPGRLTDAERELMNRHPVDGARLIFRHEEELDLAAVVAYEHHIMIDGGGYPVLRFPRDCHFASRLVHVCDVYDALRTRRPYRDAWPAGKVTSYIAERGGLEFDPDLAASFIRMMAVWGDRVVQIDPGLDPRMEAASPPPAAPPAPEKDRNNAV